MKKGADATILNLYRFLAYILMAKICTLTLMKLYNTLSKQKEYFTPLNDKTVGMYQCGPTVYWTQHIGNMRAMVMADLIERSLIYCGYKVTLVRNYTDVGHLTGDNQGDADTGIDRMAKAAEREQVDPLVIAEKYINQFEKDLILLNTLPATIKPRATEHIQEMIAFIETLIEKGFAYATPLAIYFDVSKKSDYTKLSGQDLDKNITDAGHGEVSDMDKKSPHDFALWFFKAGTHEHALQTWQSPFYSPLVENGEGFPGWHIECSAMSHKYLGETFDIHMGGIEHISIHHTNEIAQSESAFEVPMASIWMHNEHLLVDNAKMSKSEGTSYFLDDIINKGYSALDLRYFFLQAHYRSKQNFTWDALTASKNALSTIYTKIAELRKKSDNKEGIVLADISESFKEKISDDINIPQALSVLHTLLKSNESPADILTTAYYIDSVLGLQLKEYTPSVVTVPDEIQELLDERKNARKEKNWQRSDEIRDLINTLGFEISDINDEQHIQEK